MSYHDLSFGSSELVMSDPFMMSRMSIREPKPAMVANSIDVIPTIFDPVRVDRQQQEVHFDVQASDSRSIIVVFHATNSCVQASILYYVDLKYHSFGTPHTNLKKQGSFQARMKLVQGY